MNSAEPIAARLVAKPVELRELANHAEDHLPAAYGPRVFLMGDQLVPGADVFVTSRTINGLTAPAEPNVQPHRHRVSQTYLLFSADNSLEVEVELDGLRSVARAPASIFVPPGTLHAIRVLRGTGTLVSVVRSGMYD